MSSVPCGCISCAKVNKIQQLFPECLDGVWGVEILRDDIEEVTAGGESGPNARPLNFDWIKSLRDQCERKNVHFSFHQTGKNFIKDGVHYNIQRKFQHSQAKKANIDYLKSKRIKFGKAKVDTNQLSFDFDIEE